jgi:hypothetical protein
MTVADTGYSRIPNLREEFEASIREEELLVFQTNCFSNYVNSRQTEDAKLSKGNRNEDMNKLQVEVADFNDYSHRPKDIEEVEDNKEIIVATIWMQEKDEEMTSRVIHVILLEVQQQFCSNTMYQQITELNIEIDKLWKLMIKNSKWGYREMRSAFNHKIKLVERDYIIRVMGKQ